MSLCFLLAKRRTLDLSGRRVNWFNWVEARTSPRFFDIFFCGIKRAVHDLHDLSQSSFALSRFVLGDRQPMNICHCETNWIGCGASYGCTQRAESGAAMSHYLCDLIPRCAGFLGAMTGLYIHIWDCLMIFRSGLFVTQHLATDCCASNVSGAFRS